MLLQPVYILCRSSLDHLEGVALLLEHIYIGFQKNIYSADKVQMSLYSTVYNHRDALWTLRRGSNLKQRFMNGERKVYVVHNGYMFVSKRKIHMADEYLSVFEKVSSSDSLAESGPS